jgi:hypothetical protein
MVRESGGQPRGNPPGDPIGRSFRLRLLGNEVELNKCVRGNNYHTTPPPSTACQAPTRTLPAHSLKLKLAILTSEDLDLIFKFVYDVTPSTCILLTAPQVPLQIGKESVDVPGVPSFTLKVASLDPQFPNLLPCFARVRRGLQLAYHTGHVLKPSMRLRRFILRHGRFPRGLIFTFFTARQQKRQADDSDEGWIHYCFDGRQYGAIRSHETHAFGTLRDYSSGSNRSR